MSDKQEPENQTSAEAASTPIDAAPKQQVGDLIKKERITRRITIETIAKDLKLNAKYIKSLEANEYDHLPAPPYVRVYLRSIAKYLTLDADELMKRFFKECNIPPETYQKDTSQKLTVTVSQQEKHSYTTWFIVGGFLVLMILLTAIIKPSLHNPEQVNPQTATVASDTIPVDEIDSATSEIFKNIADSASTSAIKQAEAQPTAADQPLLFAIDVKRDSVWVQIFADGVSWKNFLRGGSTKTISARDSINVHVGQNSSVTYRLNGKPLLIPGERVAVFKIDHAGWAIWTLSKWTTVFKGRI